MKTALKRVGRWLVNGLFVTFLLVKLNPALAQSAKAATSPLGKRGPSSNFSGTVWVKMLVDANPETDCIVSNVTFEPKARTFWHKHPNGQLLVVTQGVGYYQEKGKPVRVIRQGESVTIAPQVEHWHGAGPSGQFTHIAINPNVSKGGAVNWLQPVSDDDYNALRKE